MKVFKNRLAWCAVLFLFFGGMVIQGCATTATTDPDSEVDNKKLARKKFQEAREFGSLDMKEEMLVALKETIDLDPKNTNYRIQLGYAYVRMEDYENGEETFLQVLEIDKNNKAALRELGTLSMRKRDWEKAVHYFSEDLKKPGTHLPHQIYNYLALSYYNMGKHENAEEQWLKALNIKENAAIRLNLALAYRDRERFDDAMVSLKKALDINPKFVQAHFEMAVLLLKKRENKKASKHFNEVLRNSPQGPWAQPSRKYIKLMQSGL